MECGAPVKKKPQERPTIKIIARLAHVSPSSVSIVLRDPGTKRVGTETKRRVLEIAAQLDYRPNYHARSLVGHGSDSIGLVLPTLANPVYVEITQGIVQRATEQNYGVIIKTIDNRGVDGERQAVFDLISRGIDGLIICSALRKDSLIEVLKERHIPFVLVARTVDQYPSSPDVDYIITNDQRGSAIALEHLYKIGYTKFAIVLGPQETSTGYNRKKGALAALKKLGISRKNILLFQGDYSRESGYNLAKEIINQPEKPQAIYSSNDIMAIGILQAFSEVSIRVPEDIALVGFDNINIASLPGVELTSVAFRLETMGMLAVDRVIDLVKKGGGDILTRVLLDPILTIRKTCGFHNCGGYKR